MKNRPIIICIISILLIFIAPVCGCVSKPALVNIGGNSTPEEMMKQLAAYQAKVKDLENKLGKAGAELQTTKEHMEELKNQTFIFMELKDAAKSMNFRVWVVIKIVAKFISRVLWAMIVSTWLMDIIVLVLLIAFATWASGVASKLLSFVSGIWGIVIKLLTFWMNFNGNWKIATTIIWAIILSVIWKWTHSPCDWLQYSLPISLISCGVANILWEYIINKTGTSDKTKAVTKTFLSEKVNSLLF